MTRTVKAYAAAFALAYAASLSTVATQSKELVPVLDRGQTAASDAAAKPDAAPSEPAIKKLNPFTGKEEGIAVGKTLYIQVGCQGCHGGGGGGGMAASLIDDSWKFGSDDETLFKLIKGQIPEQTMPVVYSALPDEQVWQILAFIRTLYKGDPSKINW